MTTFILHRAMRTIAAAALAGTAAAFAPSAVLPGSVRRASGVFPWDVRAYGSVLPHCMQRCSSARLERRGSVRRQQGFVWARGPAGGRVDSAARAKDV